MKTLIYISILILLNSCKSTNPVSTTPTQIDTTAIQIHDTANVIGTVKVFLGTIKYGGFINMEHNGLIKTSNLINEQADSNNTFHNYDFTFNNVTLTTDNNAVFILILKNGFGAEITHSDTTLVLRKGQNHLTIYVWG